MALFRNLCVKLRGFLCDVLLYVSAQPLVFLDLAKNSSFMNWQPVVSNMELMDGHQVARREFLDPIPGNYGENS